MVQIDVKVTRLTHEMNHKCQVYTILNLVRCCPMN